METKRVSRIPRSGADDFGHIPTQPFGTRAVTSAPGTAGMRPSEREFPPLRFVQTKPDARQELSASTPPTLPIEQLFDVDRLRAKLSAGADRGLPGAHRSSPPFDDPARNERSLGAVMLGAMGLAVCALALTIWLVAPSPPVGASRPSEALDVGHRSQPTSPEPTPESDIETVAFGDESQRAGLTATRAERATRAEVPSRSASPQIAVSRGSSATKKRSVLDSVLAPPPD